MKTIYKFKLDLVSKQTVVLPGFFALLKADFQNDELCLWAGVETEQTSIEYTFYIYGTGHPIDKNINLDYISTVFKDGLVWHIFYDKFSGMFINEVENERN